MTTYQNEMQNPQKYNFIIKWVGVIKEIAPGEIASPEIFR